MKRLLVVCAFASVAALMLVSTSAASSGVSAASLSVSPAAPLVGDSLVFSGCGYTPGVTIQLQAIHNTKAVTDIVQIGEAVDVNGCFSTSDYPYVVPDAGKWAATVWESSYEDAKLTFNVKSPH